MAGIRQAECKGAGVWEAGGSDHTAPSPAPNDYNVESCITLAGDSVDGQVTVHENAALSAEGGLRLVQKV